jgi:hypothetical protein
MKATWAMPRRPLARTLLAVAAVLLPLGLLEALAQRAVLNEREVKSQTLSEDSKQDIWALDFRFKDPRLIKVNVPGRGTRICWYLWYQVINRTKEPRLFIPEFELVTTDDYPRTYRDEVLPSVQDAIKKIEDPTGYQDIKNSVTITAQLIPVSKAEGTAYPRTVTGVAIWDGTSADPRDHDGKKKDLADATRFSIFVSGLSNGWVLVDALTSTGGKSEAPTIRRKTLQLNFKRLGSRMSLDSREISFEPPAQWIYRPSQIRLPAELPGPGKEKDKDAAP